MGTAVPPQPVILFVGLVSGQDELFRQATYTLTSLYGPIDLVSPIYPWNHTDYYEKELGRDLKRQFLFFRQTISPDRIAEIKEQTNSLEQQWARLSVRAINIDPGYIAPSKVVLATTKDFSHRVYLSRGIYAEVALVYRDGQFRPLEHTYPDFRTAEYLDLFKTVRERRFG